MTLELTTIKAVKSDGIVWIIKGNLLYMTDENGNGFTQFEPGSETFRYKMNQLQKLESLPESKRVEIIRKIKLNVEELLA